MAEEGEDGVVPPLPPERTFLMVDGKALHHIKTIRDTLEEHGLVTVETIKIKLNSEEARLILGLAGKALKEQAAETARSEAEAAEKEAADKKKGKRSARKSARKSARSTARSKASADSDKPQLEPFDPVVRTVEVNSLASDRCLLIVLEKLGAISLLNSVLGSGNPHEWKGAAADCMRARLAPEIDDDGNLAEYNTLHSGQTPAHVERVVSNIRDMEEMHNVLSEASGPSIVRKSPFVNLDHLYELVFPPGMQHPRSTGRLIVFGMYGPFNDQGKLCAGWKGQHVITDRELKSMIDEIEKEDLLSIFVKEKGMTEEKQMEILVDAKKGKPPLPNMSREQVEALFKPLKRNKKGMVSFHDMQALIMGARMARMKELKKMYPDLAGGKGASESKHSEQKESKVDSRTLMKTAAASGSAFRPPPPKFGRTSKLGRRADLAKRKKPPIVKVGETEGFRVVASMLNRDSHHICELEDGNDPSLTQNVRLLRDMPRAKDNGWDDYCCLSGMNRGSFVGRRAKSARGGAGGT